MKVEFFDTVEVLPPLLVVAALLHFVDARATIVDGRAAVFHSCGEHERSRHDLTCARNRRTQAATFTFQRCELQVSLRPRVASREGKSPLWWCSSKKKQQK